MAINSCQSRSIILVTAGTGFIASQVIDTLLRAPLGFSVRFTSTAKDRADATFNYFSRRYGSHRIQAMVIEDTETDGAYDEAVKGVSGIIDLACPPRICDIALESLIHSAVRSVESLLLSASKEASVKRVVHCSSTLSAGRGNSATLEDVINGIVRPVYLNAKSWNKAAESWNLNSETEVQDKEERMQVDQENQDQSIGSAQPELKNNKCEDFAEKFGIMKSKAEKAAFNFVQKQKPHFIFTSVLPAVVFGKVLPASNSISTSGWILQFSNKTDIKSSPLYSSALSQLGCPIKNDFPPQPFVDVNDLSLLFYSVLVTPSLEKNERILASTSSFSWNDVMKVLTELGVRRKEASFPYLTGDRDRVDHTVIDNGRFLELLEIKGSRPNCLFASISNTIKS